MTRAMYAFLRNGGLQIDAPLKDEVKTHNDSILVTHNNSEIHIEDSISKSNILFHSIAQKGA